MGSILVVGAGKVGGRVCALAQAAGWDVVGARRSKGTEAAWPMLALDVKDPASLEAIPASVDRVVYAVAADGRDAAAYQQAYVIGVRNVLAHLAGRGQGILRVVFVSSTAVYGQDAGEVVDENSPTQPQGFNGKVMLEAEQTVLGGPFPACVLRLGGIYGPGRTRLVDQVRNGSARLSGQAAYTNRIHEEDAARAILHLLQLSQVPPVVLGVDNHPATQDQVLCFLAQRLGLPSPPLDARALPLAQATNKRCMGRVLPATGFTFTFPDYQAGYGAMLPPV